MSNYQLQQHKFTDSQACDIPFSLEINPNYWWKINKTVSCIGKFSTMLYSCSVRLAQWD